MHLAMGTRGGRRTLAVIAGVIGVFIAARAIAAPSPATATDISPSTVKADSLQVPVFGIDLTGSEQSLTSARVEFTNVAGFTAADIERDISCDDGDLTTCDGVQIWRDTSASGLNDDALDAADTPLSSGFAFDGDCATLDYLPPDAVCAATLSLQSSAVPAEHEDLYTHFIVIRTSGTLAEGDRFEIGLRSDAFTTAPAETLTTPATTRVITADLTAPADPVVTDLGLSKALGIVRAGDTAVSAEEKASLQLWRSSEATCQGSLIKVAEGVLGDLSEPHTDLIGVTAAQAERVSSFPAASATVCYRIADEAGNLSGFTPDGRVPEAPTAADVALLSTSNLTDLKRVESAPDASGPRTFRLYLRPAGNTLERARTAEPLPARFVEVTTATGQPAASPTTDIRRWSFLSSLTAGDGIAYTRVNAAGNDSAATDDGSIPSAPSASDLGLLRTSAVEEHQRVIAGADAASARTFRLYGDTSGIGDWVPATTPAGAPVTVTTAATPRDSATTDILIGAGPLGSGDLLGFTAISAHGNGSDVAGDGSIPSAPSASSTSFSDATNSFRVMPFPVADGVGIRLFAGSTPSLAYLSGSRGEATTMAPVTVAELDGGLGLHYAAVHATSGNESPLTADGTIPSMPAADDLDVLSTSAATGHQRVIAESAEHVGRTFRLYGDPTGGRTWQPASSVAQAAAPVEITTGAARVDSNDPAPTSSIFFGATQLGAGHAVGFSRILDGNDSDVAADGAIPAAPVPAFTSVSDALDQMTATAASAASRVLLHVGPPAATATLSYDEAGPDASAQSSSAVPVTDPVAGETLFYTALDAASGNESPTAADGTVPAAPAPVETAFFGASAAQGHQRVSSTADPLGPRIMRVYVDPAASGWVRATDGAGSLVELPTAVAVGSTTATSTIMAGAEPLAAGHVVGYARRTTEGNDSDVTSDGAIPAAPSVTTLSASAASDSAKASGVDAGTQVRVFASRSATGSVAYGEGSDAALTTLFTSRPVDLSAGDRLYYTLVSDSTGNESAIAADGQIPAAPDAASTSVSDARDEFVVPQASSDNRVNIFMDPSGTPSVGYANGVDYANITTSPFAPGSDLPAQYTYYTAVDAASGNESTILADGYIPAAPTDAAAVMSASAARRRIASNPDAAARRLRLWIDPTSAGVWRMAAASVDGSGAVEVLTSTVQEILSPEGIFVSGQPLGAGMNVGYTRLVSGNESDVASDGVVPAAPQNPSHFTANANTGTATVAALAPTGTYRVFAGTDPVSARTLHTTGLTTTIDVAGFDQGDVVGYARTEGGNESPALIDGTIPDAPGLSMQDGSDTGSSDDDGVTSDDTPTIDASTQPGGTVTVSEDGSSLGSGSANDSGIASLTLPARSEGEHLITAITTVGGNTSPPSEALPITVDKSAPVAPGLPVLSAASDTGRSNSDRVTSDATPTFGVTTEPAALVTLIENGTVLGSASADGGAANPTASTLSDGDHIIGARATDLAGNASTLSSPMTITVDTQAPLAPQAPDLLAASDTGSADADEVTADATPSFLVSGTDTGSSIALVAGDVETASTIADGDQVTLLSGTLDDGVHQITARATDRAGNTSDASGVLGVRIDTVATSLPPLVLDEGSDTGVSESDAITALDELTVIGSGAEPGATITVIEQGSERVSDTASDDGEATFVLGFDAGAHELVARQTDAAGNTSPVSPVTSIVIDTASPSASLQAPSTLEGIASVTFTEAVAGVTEENFVLRQDGSSVPVSGVVSMASDGRRATLRPAATLRPGTSYTLELAPEGGEAPIDIAGNEVAARSVRFVTAQQQSVAPWSRVSASRAFGSSYVRQNTPGAAATYSFSGTSITVYTVKSSTGGFARVLIDGEYVTTINTYARAVTYKAATTFRNLGSGQHRIQIVVGAGRPAGSAGSMVALDAFRAGSDSVDATPRLVYGTASSAARRPR